MRRWRKFAGATLACLVAVASPMVAGTPRALAADPPAEEVRIVDAITIAAPVKGPELCLKGEVTYVDLEGGFYAVKGWMLRGDVHAFESLLGREVVVVGTRFEGMSIQMVKSMDVTEIVPAESWTGGELWLTNGPESLESEKLLVLARREKPAGVILDGVEVSFDQGPEVVDGILMVPIRAMVEAAGGSVEWDGDRRTVSIALKGQGIILGIGKETAEVSQGEVSQGEVSQGTERPLDLPLAREVRMARAPEIVNGRTLVSADALSTILGFSERNREDGVMELQSIASLEQDLLTGTIKEVSESKPVRILVQGKPMSNGEPMLIWVTVFDDTSIVVRKGEAKEKASVSELAAGQNVEVFLSGPILESYPAQGGASSIVIIK